MFDDTGVFMVIFSPPLLQQKWPLVITTTSTVVLLLADLCETQLVK